MRLKYSLAAAAAVAALVPQAQQGGPPGSEDPGYGRDEDEVETIIVIGNRYRCPNGTLVRHVVNCPSFVSFSIDYNLAPYDPATHMIRQAQGTAHTCGSTVDANCECGTGKVKVYDEDADAFHCYAEPPAAGCPQWDQTFDFDLGVWACVTRPLDADPEKMAERVKNCGAPTVNSYWHHSPLSVEYGSLPAGHPAAAGCGPPGNNPPTDIRIRYDRNQLAGGSMAWHWAAISTIHEFVHVSDYVRYNSCAPWLTRQGKADLEKAEYEATQQGMHSWVYQRAHIEFYNTFGVMAPSDPDYRAADHNKPLSCLFD